MSGDPMKTVSLIIPAYNEEEAIPHFLERIVPLLDAEPYTFEMIFIDDGSKDRTLEILLEARRKDPRIKMCIRDRSKTLSLSSKRGQTHWKVPQAIFGFARRGGQTLLQGQATLCLEARPTHAR